MGIRREFEGIGSLIKSAVWRVHQPIPSREPVVQPVEIGQLATVVLPPSSLPDNPSRPRSPENSPQSSELTETDRENEVLRVIVTGLQPLDLSVLRKKKEEWFTDSELSEEERVQKAEQHEGTLNALTAYYWLLVHPANRRHFDNPPKTSEDLRRRWDRPGYYPLVARNMLGEVVGGLTIADAEKDQHDHWITKVAVDPKLKGQGVGKQIMYYGIEWAFSHPTYDGRERRKLDTSIIEDIPGWKRMQRLVEGLAFDYRMRLPEQVTIGGKVYATQRWELLRWKWYIFRTHIHTQIKEYLDSLKNPPPA